MDDQGTDDARTPSGRTRGRRGRRGLVALALLAVVVVVGVALALGARSLLSAKHQAEQAQESLTAAKAALDQQHVGQARAYVAQARTHVAQARTDAAGTGGDLWSWVPVAGSAVDDERHLIDALDQTTSVAELGVKIYPMVSGDSASLVRGTRIDIATLKDVAAQTSAIGPHLDRALADLDRVKGSTPVVGGSITHARDTARTYLEPLQASYAKNAPLLDSLPSIVGADGPRTYLLAMLNPSELRYSGGGTLSFTTLRFDHGVATFGSTVNVEDLYAAGKIQQTWPRVPGNIFRQHETMPITNATFSPWWSVSGEELLRAYNKAYPSPRLQGVIGVDLQALADLFRITGPVSLPPVGTIDADNLVQTLAGSYGDFTSNEVRHRLNKELVPAFRTKFFEQGAMKQKVQSLVDSAQGRHFFLYFRDARVQKRFAAVGLSGDLSDTTQDYLGVFTQNLNGSKVDFWQQRSLVRHVVLDADGSARVRLATTVANDAPAYAGPGQDPRSGYPTSYLGALLAVFLPDGAHVTSLTMDGKAVPAKVKQPHVRSVHDRPLFSVSVLLNSGEQAQQVASYRVPHAASLDRDGDLVYRLAIDPQDTVRPQALTETLRFPSGWTATSLPTGWTAVPGGARLTTQVATTTSYEIVLHHR